MDAALGDGVEHRLVVRAEEVETAIAASGVLDRAADLVDLLDPIGRIVDCGQEVEVTPVCLYPMPF